MFKRYLSVTILGVALTLSPMVAMQALACGGDENVCREPLPQMLAIDAGPYDAGSWGGGGYDAGRHWECNHFSAGVKAILSKDPSLELSATLDCSR